MIGSLELDLTSVLTPFGWAGATFVIAGLAGLLVEAMRERRASVRHPVDSVAGSDPRLAA